MKKQIKAFTLIELITTIAVLAILVAIAIPNMQNMVLENRLVAFSNDFSNSVSLARNEALTRRQSVSISPAEGDWSKGWEVIIDDTNEVIGSSESYSHLTLTEPADLQITSRGILKGLAWDGIKACDKRGKCRVLNLSGAGVISISKEGYE